MERKKLQIKVNKSSKKTAVNEVVEATAEEVIEEPVLAAEEALEAVEVAEDAPVNETLFNEIDGTQESLFDAPAEVFEETEELVEEFFVEEEAEELVEDIFVEEETEELTEDIFVEEEAEELTEDIFVEEEAEESDFFAEVSDETAEEFAAVEEFETEDSDVSDFFAEVDEANEAQGEVFFDEEVSEEVFADETSDEEYAESEEIEKYETESEEVDDVFGEVDEAIAAQKEVLEELESSEPVENYVVFQDVTKTYTMGETTISALNGINFSANKGELVVVVGASGAGKSTILNILGGIDQATSGQVIIDGNDICKCNNKQMVMYRRHDVGFVFQFYNLVQNLTARENVELATQICTNPFDVDEMLEAVGLSHRKNNFPSQLSGGEQQRVAIARALAKNPKLLLCDEPTGALDYNTGKAILQLLQDTARQAKMTVFIITHNYALTDIGDRVVKVKNGLIEEIIVNENPMDIKDIEW